MYVILYIVLVNKVHDSVYYIYVFIQLQHWCDYLVATSLRWFVWPATILQLNLNKKSSLLVYTSAV